MSTIQNQEFNTNNDFLSIYNTFKGNDGEPIIEDMEPGKIYALELKNNRAIRRLKAENNMMRDKYFLSIIINLILTIAIVCIVIFTCNKINKLNAALNSLNEEYDEISQMHQSAQIIADNLNEKVLSVTDTMVNFSDTVEESPRPEEQVSQEVTEPQADTVTVDFLQKYEDVPLDNDLKLYIYNKAMENDIPPEVLFSIAWQETKYTPDAVSATNDHGLFQINEYNFEYLANRFGWTLEEFWDKIYDPYVNTDCAVIILEHCYNNYHNDNWHHVLMRYNIGPGGAEEFFADGIYSTNYSRSALGYAADTFGFTDIVIN